MEKFLPGISVRSIEDRLREEVLRYSVSETVLGGDTTLCPAPAAPAADGYAHKISKLGKRVIEPVCRALARLFA